MSAWIVDRRDRRAQRLVNGHTIEPEPPRFVVVEAETAQEAFKKADERGAA